MLLRNCRLLAEFSDGIKAESGNVLIIGDKISAVCVSESETLLGDHEVIDCKGKTLLPGLIDAHTHITGLRGYSPRDVLAPMKLLKLACSHVRGYLDYGFTTIRDCGSAARVANYVRDMIDSGLCKGPRVISSGLILTPTESEEADSLDDMSATADGIDEIRKAVRKEIAEHADFIKIYASGSALYAQGIPKQSIMTREEIRTAVESAQMKSTYVAAHAHSDAAIKLCILEGVKTIEHSTYISDASLELLKNSQTALVPTLAAMYVTNASPDPNDFWNVRLGSMLKVTGEAMEKAYRLGIRLGFGTDSTAGMDQYEQGIEFRYRKEYCHIGNTEILLQATKYNAELLGISDSVGEIKQNLLADLILADGNPDEDLSVMYHKPVMVWKSGKLVRGNS